MTSNGFLSASDHLGSCSECFGEFNRLKVAFRARRRQQFILYGALACIVLASAGLLWKQLSRGREISTPGMAATKPAVVPGDRSGRQDVASTKFSLDYCEHRASHAGLGASESLIIPNGRIMDKNCLRPVCP
jgi:hypothetical protein